MVALWFLLFLSIFIVVFLVAPGILLVNDLKKGTCELLGVALASVAFLVALTILMPGCMVGLNNFQIKVAKVRSHFMDVYFFSRDEETFFEKHGRYAALDELERGGPVAQSVRMRMSFYLSSDRNHWCTYLPIDVPPFEFCVMFQDDRDRFGLIFDPDLKGIGRVPLGTAYADAPFGDRLRDGVTPLRRVLELREEFVYWHRLVPIAIVLSVIVVARMLLRWRGLRWRPLVVADAVVLFVVWVILLGRLTLLFM